MGAWLPWSKDQRVPITFVHDGHLAQRDVSGTPSEETRRAFHQLEGVMWIRGHHDEDSFEAQALLAAHALNGDHE